LFCSNHQLKAQQERKKKLVDSLINVLAKQKEDSSKALILLNITRFKMGDAQNTGNWDEAIDWARKSLLLSTKTNYQFGIGRANINLGQCWMQKGDYAEAIKYFYAALNLSFKNGRKVLTVAASVNLAGCYMQLGKYQESLKYQLLSYKTTQQLNNDGPADLQQIAAGIAGLYSKMQNWKEALNWYQKALPDNPELFYEGDITLQIASIQMEMKRYDEALKNFRVAIQLFPARFKRKPDTDYKGLVGGWFSQLGETYINIGNLTKDSERIAAFREAINYLNKSIPLLEKNAGGKESLMNAYALLKKACEAINDYQNALYFTNLYMGLRDSIYNKTSYLKLADLQMQIEREKTSAEEKVRLEKIKLNDQASLAEQKLQNERQLSKEKLTYEQRIAEEKLQQQTVMAEEKLKHNKIVALEKEKQVKLQLEKKRMNSLLLIGSFTLIVISVLLFLLIRQRNLKKRAIEKANSVHSMAELEMQSLRIQLNPHFMFNSLNAIQELILLEDTERSHIYLSRFSKLMRMLLENAETPFILLRKEINFLQLYLDLENLRVPDLEYSISTDPVIKTEETFIPNMILQPYIENAIWHGLSHKQNNKQLQIRIYSENGTVNYEIEDNGVGRKKAAELKSLFRQKHQSKGMELLSKRFKLLNEEYSSDINTTITDVIKNNEVAGTMVTIKVPVGLSKHLQN
jgi:LytS/YehU family sensor histidine kinase